MCRTMGPTEKASTTRARAAWPSRVLYHAGERYRGAQAEVAGQATEARHLGTVANEDEPEPRKARLEPAHRLQQDVETVKGVNRRDPEEPAGQPAEPREREGVEAVHSQRVSLDPGLPEALEEGAVGGDQELQDADGVRHE